MDKDDHNLLAAAVERLAERHLDPDSWRKDGIVCGEALWTTFAEQGVLAIGIAPEFGGIGGGIAEQAMVMRQIGKNLLPLPFMDNVVVSAQLIAALGSSGQKESLLPAIAAGELRIGFAHREAAAGDAFDFVETSVASERLRGEKVHVIDGVEARRFLVSAMDQEGLLRFFLIDRRQAGVDIQIYRLPDNRLAARLVLDGAVGEPIGGDARVALASIYDHAAVCTAAETHGAMLGLFRDTLEYAKIRHQFGRPIGSFQVLQHRLVDGFIAEQTTAALVADAVSALERGLASAGTHVSAAKAQADRAGRQLGESAIQIYGGMGLTDECSAGHFLKRILTNGSQFRTAKWHVDRIARAIV